MPTEPLYFDYRYGVTGDGWRDKWRLTRYIRRRIREDVRPCLAGPFAGLRVRWLAAMVRVDVAHCPDLQPGPGLIASARFSVGGD